MTQPLRYSKEPPEEPSAPVHEHVFVDRHSGQFVAVEDLHAGLYLQQQTMIDVQPDGVTFWHEVVLMDEVYPSDASGGA